MPCVTRARLDHCFAPSDGCPEGSQALGCLGVPDRGFLISRGQAATLPKVASSADFENRDALWGSQVRSASWKEPRSCLVPSFPRSPTVNTGWAVAGPQRPSGDTGPRAGNTCPGSKSAAGLGALSCLPRSPRSPSGWGHLPSTCCGPAPSWTGRHRQVHGVRLRQSTDSGLPGRLPAGGGRGRRLREPGAVRPGWVH